MDYSKNTFSENILDIQDPIVVTETYLGDNNYFDIGFVDQKFSEIKDIEDEKEKSKAVAKLLYDIVQNVAASCCKSVSLKGLFEKNYKYNHIITKSFDKYSKYVLEEDKKKVRRAIDSAFKGDWRDGLVKGAVGFVVDLLVPREFKVFKDFMGKYCGGLGAAIYSAAVKKVGEEKAREMGHKVADASFALLHPFLTDMIRSVPKDILKGIFFEICPPKFKSIGEALVIYKKSSQPNTFSLSYTTDGAKYCFDITSQVMEDIIKVYRKL